MRNVVLFFLTLLLFIPNIGYSAHKFNPMSGEWETVPNGSNWQNRYNPHDGSWSYQPQNARKEYNPMSGKWEWDSGHN